MRKVSGIGWLTLNRKHQYCAPDGALRFKKFRLATENEALCGGNTRTIQSPPCGGLIGTRTRLTHSLLTMSPLKYDTADSRRVVLGRRKCHW